MRKIKFKRLLILMVLAAPLLLVSGSFLGPTDEVEVQVGEFSIRSAQFEQLFNEQLIKASRITGFELSNTSARRRLAAELRHTLASQFLLATMIAKLGLDPTDNEIYSRISEIPEFQEAGKFSRSRFSSLVPDEREFLKNTRQQLVTGRMLWLTTISAVADDDLAGEIAKYYAAVRTVSKHVLRVEDVLPSISLTEQQAKDYYLANTKDYAVPEQAEFEYIEFSRAALAEKIEIGEEELRAAYEVRQDLNSFNEERQLQLIETSSAAAAEVALARLQSEPEDFPAVARELSEDEGSSELGGDLGFFRRDDLPPAIADDVFSAAVGTVLEPFDNDGRWQIFRIAGKIGGTTRSFAEERESLMQQLRFEQSEVLFEEQAKELEDLAYAAGDSLTSAAARFELEIQASGPVLYRFSRQDENPALFQSAGVLATIFAPEFLAADLNSGLLLSGSDHYLVVRPLAHQPAYTKTFDDAEDEVWKAAELSLAREQLYQRALDLAIQLAADPATDEVEFELSADLNLAVTEELPEGFAAADVNAAYGSNLFGESLPAFAVVRAPDGLSVGLLRVEKIVAGAGTEQEKVQRNARKIIFSVGSIPSEIVILEELGQRYDKFIRAPGV